MEHTQGRITFKADGDACHWSMLTEDGRWWLAILANGEQPSERQIANFRRLAACWNACEGITTDDIEAGKHVGLIRAIYAKNAAEHHRERPGSQEVGAA